jgi:hypothetical protein
VEEPGAAVFEAEVILAGGADVGIGDVRGYRQCQVCRGAARRGGKARGRRGRCDAGEARAHNEGKQFELMKKSIHAELRLEACEERIGF